MAINQPKFVIKNQFGEQSNCYVLVTDQAAYSLAGSYQEIPVLMNVAAGVGANTPSTPVLLSGILSQVASTVALTKTGNIIAGIIGIYSITGSGASLLPKAAVVGLLTQPADDLAGSVEDPDAAFMAVQQDNGVVCQADAAFGVQSLNTASGTGYVYGVDLYSASGNGYLAQKYLNADIRMSNQVCILNVAGVPVDGTTGDLFAGPGSICIKNDSGAAAAYINTNTAISTAWKQLLTTGNPTVVTSTVLTGFSSTTGLVLATDTILTALEKLYGNLNNGTNIAPNSEVISAAGAISTTVLESFLNNLTGGTFAATLAAPVSQDGQLKILKMSGSTHTVTLAMTNISVSGAYTPTGTTTLTFTITGHTAILMAVGSKWVYLGGSAVAS